MGISIRRNTIKKAKPKVRTPKGLATAITELIVVTNPGVNVGPNVLIFSISQILQATETSSKSFKALFIQIVLNQLFLLFLSGLQDYVPLRGCSLNGCRWS